jgi:hypothetical protein
LFGAFGAIWKMTTAPTDLAVVSISPEAAIASPTLMSVALMVSGGVNCGSVSDELRRGPPPFIIRVFTLY